MSLINHRWTRANILMFMNSCWFFWPFTTGKVQNSLNMIFLNVTHHSYGSDDSSFGFFPIFGGHKSFLWGHSYPCFGLLVTSPAWFQRQSGQPYSHLAEVYMLHIPWDSPLVWHLLTSWWSVWQLSQSLPHTSKQALVGLKTRTYHAAGECSTNWTMPAELTFGIFNYFRDEQISFNVSKWQ